MTRIVIFARAPVRGACKTRLIPVLGPEGAAQLHAAMVERALQTALASGLGPVELHGAPDVEHPFFQSLKVRLPITFVSQIPGDLGARMHAVFASAHGPTLLMGTDAPCITPEHLRACAAALAEGHDAVFLPAEDGGYGLVGLAKPCPEIFTDMPWGTAAVMAETRSRLRALGRSCFEPATIWDVDEPADLLRLQQSGLMSFPPIPSP